MLSLLFSSYRLLLFSTDFVKFFVIVFTLTSNADFAWRLLKHYLELYETCETQYYKCVTRRLLTQGFTLPNWLTEQYKVMYPQSRHIAQFACSSELVCSVACFL